MDRRFIGGVLALLTVSGAAVGQSPRGVEWKTQRGDSHRVITADFGASTPKSPAIVGMTELQDQPGAAKASDQPAAKSAEGVKPGDTGKPVVTSKDGSCCGTDNCQPCVPCTPCCDPGCGPEGKYWVQADYLLWWLKSAPIPPLITTSPVGTPRPQAGVLGQPGTIILFPGDSEEENPRSGGYLTVGGWLNDCRTFGLEAYIFYLEDDGRSFQIASDGSTILARPFFNTQTNQQDAQLDAFPGLLSGSKSVSATTTNFLGAGINAIHNVCCDCCYRFDLVYGYRYLRLEEELTVFETLVSIDPQGLVPPGTTFALTDRFETQNDFHGGVIGASAEFWVNNLSVRLLGNVALGVTRQRVQINGSTVITVPGTPSEEFVGGLLALPTNIGSYSRNEFAVVPEVGLRIGYQVTCNIRATVGYNLIYWSDVVRPGDQIDLVINPTQLPPGTLEGAARPAFNFNSSDFWAQGVSFGLELRF